MRLDTEALVAIDVETTGVNPFVHQLLSVALVPIGREGPSLELHVRYPNLNWSNFGYRNYLQFRERWSNEAVDAKVALHRIEKFISAIGGGRPVTPVGHNVGFDIAFLRQLAAATGHDEVQGLSHRSLDTHTLLYIAWMQGRIPSDARTSDGAFRCFGLKPTGRHTAIGDALATKDLFLRLVDLLTVEDTLSADVSC